MADPFNSSSDGQIVYGKTHVGSTVGVLIRTEMVDDCPGDQTLVTNITDQIDFAPGVFFVTSNLISQPILLPFLAFSANIINVTNGPFAGSAYTYVVPPNASFQVITNRANQMALDTNSVTKPNGLLGGIGSAQIRVLRPALSLTEFCTGTSANGLTLFSGSVSNSGDVVLTNVFVVNEKKTNNTVVEPITLGVGQSVSFTGSYTPATGGPNTLTAFGTDELFCTVSDTVTQTCLPTLHIYSAVEIEFLTVTGLLYQIQTSPDLTNWTNFGPSFPGDGNIWNKLYSTRSPVRLFYRVQQTQ
jgi:hypothetical protein